MASPGDTRGEDGTANAIVKSNLSYPLSRGQHPADKSNQGPRCAKSSTRSSMESSPIVVRAPASAAAHMCGTLASQNPDSPEPSRSRMYRPAIQPRHEDSILCRPLLPVARSGSFANNMRYSISHAAADPTGAPYLVSSSLRPASLHDLREPCWPGVSPCMAHCICLGSHNFRITATVDRTRWAMCYPPPINAADRVGFVNVCTRRRPLIRMQPH
ncbi:hypothetical protein IQ06DRAFT_3075 [Phaeosphaeriaceae sp. SRC1lsM3a]|nr:hypothetical protein IQ06DRAFT_3075 [Stagonospora sp. SRC1lsM3a]